MLATKPIKSRKGALWEEILRFSQGASLPQFVEAALQQRF
jgi:hypothetical protein